MRIRAPLAGAALAAIFTLTFFAADAMAAKEKFQRTKPHVNVGTIGNTDQGPGDLASPDGNGTAPPDDTPSGGQDCIPDPSKPADAQTC